MASGLSSEMYNHITSYLPRVKFDDDFKPVNRKVFSKNRRYPVICLGDKVISLHQAIAIKVHGDACIGLQVNHIDGNKQNNHPSNLELVTAKENVNHAVLTGLVTNIGSNNPYSKLKESQVLIIRKAHADGFGTRFLAERYGVTPELIQGIVNRTRWRHI